jgi:hypothetical protein
MPYFDGVCGGVTDHGVLPEGKSDGEGAVTVVSVCVWSGGVCSPEVGGASGFEAEQHFGDTGGSAQAAGFRDSEAGG